VTVTLRSVLTESRELGFLGPQPVAAQIAHSHAFAAACPAAPARFLDLGSGGGVPGLVLCERWPSASAVLLDASARRTAFLDRAVAALGWAGRVEVERGRAEDVGHDVTRREQFGLVVARGFGPPAVVAECAAAFVAPGGRLVVSEPPGGARRWRDDGLATLSFGPAEPAVLGGVHVVSVPKVGGLGPGYPRRTGIPRKRPLWS
jgi:16S rRNA (guanine527-N7)-methyltransferase